MSNNQNINIELNMPSNIISTLNNINSSLQQIEASSNKTKSSFREIGSTASGFNSILTAVGNVHKMLDKKTKSTAAATTASRTLALAKEREKKAMAKLTAAEAKQEKVRARGTAVTAKQTKVKKKQASITTKLAVATKKETAAQKINKKIRAQNIALQTSAVQVNLARKGGKKKEIALAKAENAAIKTNIAALKKQKAAVAGYNKLLVVKAVKLVAATVKKWALNIAMYANPIMLIVIAIAAVIAAIVALILIGARLLSFFSSSNRAGRENARALENLQERTEASAKAYDNLQGSVARQATVSNNLTNELERLSRAENKSADDKARMRTIVNQLSDSYGCLNHLLDEEGNLLAGSADEMRKLIRERENSERFAASQARQNELAGEFADAIEGQARAQAHLDQLMENGASRRAIRKAQETLDGFNESVDELGAAVQENNEILRYEFTDAGVSIEELAEKYNKSTDDIRRYMEENGQDLTEWSQNAEQALIDYANYWGYCIDDVRAEMEKYGLSVEEMQENSQRAFEDMQNQIRETTGNIINNFREIPDSFDKSSEELLEIMRNNRKRYNEWRQNMNEITERLGPEMAEIIKSKGPEFNSAIVEMLDCETELEKWRYELGQIMDDSAAHVTGTFGDRDVSEAPSDMITEAAENVANNNSLVNAVDETVNNVTENVNESAQTGGQRVGQTYTQAMSQGVVEGMPAVNRTLEAALNSIIVQFNALERHLTTAGTNAMRGFARGMMQQSILVAQEARSIVQNVERIISVTLRINSPSRVMMELGEHAMNGFAIGMQNMQRKIRQVVNETASIVTAGMNAVLGGGISSGNMVLASVGNSSIRQDMHMQRLINAVECGKYIVMDTGELVGATQKQYDVAHGKTINYNSRWGK